MQQRVIGQTRRIPSIDIIRGIAVLGIFTMNAADMAYPQDLVLDFHATDPAMGWNYWVAFTFEVLFSGKMRGLFTLVFGVSSVLIIERSTRKTDGLTAADHYFRRLLWLLIFGLVNAYIFLWWGDVLFKYALLGMLLFSFRRASNKILTVAMLTCLAVLTVQPYADYRELADLEQQYIGVQGKQRSAQPLTSDDYEVVDQWQEILADMRPDYESIEDEIQLKSGNYAGIFKYNVNYVFEEQTSIFYAEDVWDMLLFMLLGIMLLRMNYFEERVPQLVHLSIALFGIGVGLAIHVWLNLGVYANYSDPVASLYYLVFFDLGRVPFVAGYMSLTILVFRSEVFKYIGDGMAAVGRMALSNYLMQSIIGAFVFYGFGLAHFNQMSRLDLAEFVFLACIFQIAFSVVWMRLFCCGPAEWLWRSLTYWEAQPLRRTRAG
jgi:uncharacterized protein